MRECVRLTREHSEPPYNKDNAADATLYVAAQALAIRTVFSGVYLDWLGTADGFRWHATRRVETIEPRHIAAIRRFQRGWRKKLRERKEAAEAAEAQVSSGVGVVRAAMLLYNLYI